jgi:hypothetical protein
MTAGHSLGWDFGQFYVSEIAHRQEVGILTLFGLEFSGTATVPEVQEKLKGPRRTLSESSLKSVRRDKRIEACGLM